MSIRIWVALCCGLTLPFAISRLSADAVGEGPWKPGPLLRREKYLNSAVKFSPDGSEVFTLGATTGGTNASVLIEVRQASTGALLDSVGEPDGVSSFDLAALPDNVSLFYGLATNDDKDRLQAGLRVVNGRTKAQKKSELSPGFISRLALSGDGKKAIVALEQGDDPDQTVEIQLWDAANLKRLSTLDKVKCPNAMAVACSRDGASVAACFLAKSDKGPVVQTMVWDARSGEIRRTFRGAENHFSGILAFSPDGDLLALAARGPGADQSRDSLVLRRIDTGASQQTLVMPEGLVTAAEFSSDGSHLVAVGAVAEGEPKRARDGVLYVWDTKTGRLIQKTVEPGFPIKAVAFSPDGSRIAIAGYSSRDEGPTAAHSRVFTRAAKP